MKTVKLMLGDNMESLKKIPDNSIDSVVTDAPYGLGKEPDPNIILKDWVEKGYSEISGKGFMGKEWDAFVPQPAFWKEVFRVLKPGGHLLCFFGTRTYDWGVMSIRMAGFEIRDQIQWIYGQGFPKSHNISKAIDKVEGNERKVIGRKIQRVDGTLRNVGSNGSPFLKDGISGSINKATDGYIDIEEPGSDNSKRYEGWGTALKPANEPICVARKPLSEKSIAENVLKWGTGGINIDGCRVGYTSEADKESAKPGSLNATGENSMFGLKSGNEQNESGRFPANIIFECTCDEVIKGEKGEMYIRKKESGFRSSFIGGGDVNGEGSIMGNYNDTGDIHTNPECPCYILDKQSGFSKSNCKSGIVEGKEANVFNDGNKKTSGHKSKIMVGDYNDKGGSSRFFYQAKVSKSERNMGLDEFEDKPTKGSIGLHNVGGSPTKDNDRINKNTHPTLKPVSLMSYLVRLVTPPNGIVLDPFMGSGSTGISAQLEGFRFVGMELDEEYFKIATKRIEEWEKYKKFIK